MNHDRSATPRSRARSAILASRLMTRSLLPNKLMSELSGQSGHALPVHYRQLRATTGIAMIGRYWRKAAVREFSLCHAQILKRQGANGMCCMPSARAPPKRSGAILTSVIMGARLGPAELEKRHMSDLRNDVPEQLDVLPKVPGRLVGDSYDIPATRRLVMSPFLDRFSKSYIPTGTVAVVSLAAMAGGLGDSHPP